MKVVYWSSTGNTEKMAEMLAEEIKNAGGSAEVSEVSTVSPTDLEGETVFALGASAMGDEELDEGEMEPFVEEVVGTVIANNEPGDDDQANLAELAKKLV